MAGRRATDQDGVKACFRLKMASNPVNVRRNSDLIPIFLSLISTAVGHRGRIVISGSLMGLAVLRFEIID